MKRLCLLSVLVLAVARPTLGEPTAMANPPSRLDLQSYLSELDRWSASVDRLREHPEEAVTLRKTLPPQWSVSVQEQQFQVSTEWLGEALDKLAKNPKAAHQLSAEVSGRLRSMRDDAQALTQNSTMDPGTVRARLDNILKRREFRSVRTAEEPESLLDQFTDWIWRILNRIFRGAANHPKVATVLQWVVLILLILVFLAWLVYSLSRVSLSDLASRRRLIAAGGISPAKTWAEMARSAQAAAVRGDFREAIRIIYNAAVLRISEAGAWRLDPARTHREYLLLLPQNSLQRPHLTAIVTCFERVWYGHAVATAVDYESAMSELESLP